MVHCALKAEVVLMLLEARPSLVTSMTKEGNTCAHIAAEKGSTLVVEKLMKFDKIAVISSRNKTEEATALHVAAHGGHRDLVASLMAAGAQTTDETREGHTPLLIAAMKGHVDLINDMASAGVNMRLVKNKLHLFARQ